MKPKTLEEIFNESLNDSESVNLDGKGYESRMMKGVRIINENGNIQIFNPKGKDYYEELTENEYALFNQGWRLGVYNLVLKVYRKRLNFIEKRIAQEINKKKRHSSLKGFRDKRLSIMNNYYKITQKLNQLL